MPTPTTTSTTSTGSTRSPTSSRSRLSTDDTSARTWTRPPPPRCPSFSARYRTPPAHSWECGPARTPRSHCSEPNHEPPEPVHDPPGRMCRPVRVSLSDPVDESYFLAVIDETGKLLTSTTPRR